MRRCESVDVVFITGMGILQTLSSLVVNGEAERASSLLNARYPDDDLKAYRMWGMVRGLVTGDDTNRDPSYLPRLHALIDSLPETHPDRHLLQRLAGASLSVQHKTFVYPKRKPFQDEEVGKIFFGMPPAIPAVYAFTVPQARRENANIIKVEARTGRHLQLRESEIIPETVIDKTVEDAKAYVASRFRVVDHPQFFALASALALLSGRRTMEIMHSLQWKSNGKEYQASVSGLSKRGFMTWDQPTWVDIPLLISYHDFDVAMRYLRSAKDRKGRMIGEYLSKKVTGYSSAKGYRMVFGDFKMTHTISRSLYLMVGFKRRFDENEFHPEMSELMWKHHALAHMDKVDMRANIHHYNRVVIDRRTI